MRKLISTTSFVFVLFFFGHSQQLKDKEELKASNTIIMFLKWYKTTIYSNNNSTKSTEPSYSIVKDIPINTKFKKQRINNDGVEKYLEFYRKSGFLSEEYLNSLKLYFKEINKNLIKNPPIRINEIIKIDGLDQDIILDTFEPEEILDNLDQSKTTKILVIYNKALVGVNFKDGIDMVFQLTKIKDKWLIDYIGADNTNMNSFFRQ